MTTPKAITFMVVGVLGVMAITFMGTLSACVLFGLEPNNDIMRSMESAGMYVLGAFTGLLVNTRSQQPDNNDERTDSNSNIHSSTDSKPDSDPASESNSKSES